MWQSRVGLSLIAFICSLLFAGVASAHYYDRDDDHYDRDNVFRPYQVYPPMMARSGYGHRACYMVGGKHRHGKYYPAHRVCRYYTGHYVCARYVLSITPIHRDKMCTEWVRVGGHHYWRYHHRHHHYYK